MVKSLFIHLFILFFIHLSLSSFCFFILFFIFFTFSSPVSLFLCLVVYTSFLSSCPHHSLSPFLSFILLSFLASCLHSVLFFLLLIHMFAYSFLNSSFFSCLPTFFSPSFFRAFSLLFFRSFFPSFLHFSFFHCSQSEALLTVHFSLHWTGNILYT